MATPEELEKERKEGFDKIVIGGTSRNGKKIYDIYAKGDEYVIYSIDSGLTIKGIRVLIAARDPDNLVPIQNYQEVKIEYDQLKAVSDMCEGSSYAARVAQALSMAICGDIDEAKIILLKIHKNIIDRYKERVNGKLIYMSGTLIIALLICSIGLYLYICQPEFIVNDRKPLYELILVCSLATLGGIISVTRKINSINIDKGLGVIPYFISGVERNLFSILGGIFIYLVIKSNLLFGFINTLENPLYALLVFGFLAGFSETLVPNALKKLEERANTESKE